MSLQIRRVVTGHAESGRAIVKIDEIAKNVISNRPGASSCVVWSTTGFPVDNDGFEDPTTGSFKTTVEGGTVFRIVRYGPGVAPRNHRTDSIDYAVVVAGEIEMELDDGVVTKLKTGDVLVQRGTIHNWVNRGTEACVIAFVLISAKPVTAVGKLLHAVGCSQSIRLNSRGLHRSRHSLDFVAEELRRFGGVPVIWNVTIALHDHSNCWDLQLSLPQT